MVQDQTQTFTKEDYRNIKLKEIPPEEVERRLKELQSRKAFYFIMIFLFTFFLGAVFLYEFNHNRMFIGSFIVLIFLSILFFGYKNLKRVDEDKNYCFEIEILEHLKPEKDHTKAWKLRVKGRCTETNYISEFFVTEQEFRRNDGEKMILLVSDKEKVYFEESIPGQ